VHEDSIELKMQKAKCEREIERFLRLVQALSCLNRQEYNKKRNGVIREIYEMLRYTIIGSM
jgi:hypothetical protein